MTQRGSPSNNRLQSARSRRIRTDVEWVTPLSRQTRFEDRRIGPSPQTDYVNTECFADAEIRIVVANGHVTLVVFYNGE
jgi:hypothetical protein